MTAEDLRARLDALPLDAEDLAVLTTLADMVAAVTATLASTELGRER